MEITDGTEERGGRLDSAGVKAKVKKCVFACSLLLPKWCRRADFVPSSCCSFPFTLNYCIEI